MNGTSADSHAQGGPPAPDADDRVTEALWRRALEAWSDDKVHGAFLEHCRSQRRLGVAAARYRAEARASVAAGRDDGHAEIAEKRLRATLALALAELVATRTHEEPTAHATARKALRGLVVLLCAAMIVFSLYETMIR